MNDASLFAHLYDPQRVELAQTILHKELRKLLLDLPQGAWPAIDASVRGWANEPERFHFSGEQLRDFWDSFAAVLEGVKLKPDFVSLVTAENARWQRRTINVRDVEVTIMLEQLKLVPNLRLRRHIPIAEVLEALAHNPAALAEQRRINDAHTTDGAQDAYPVIVRSNGNHYNIVDGNRRTLRAALYGRKTIDAWAVSYDGALQNFWTPLNDLLQLVELFKRSDDAVLQTAIASVLRAKFAANGVAKRMYELRISIHDAAAEDLYKLATA